MFSFYWVFCVKEIYNDHADIVYILYCSKEDKTFFFKCQPLGWAAVDFWESVGWLCTVS